MSDDPGYEFALCLTHDVDRVYKTYQWVYNAVRDRDPRELAGIVSARNPYWQFERILDVELSAGVRSSFNVLSEQSLAQRPVTDWFTKSGWKLFGGRYDVADPDVSATLRTLDELGWELGLHGSYTSSEDPARFAIEKERIESVTGTEIVGNRQHYWRLDRPDTWRHLHDVGIGYDTSLGDSHLTGFQEGYHLLRPFDDEFVVFPWSLMDGAVMRSADTLDGVLATCQDVLDETRANRSVVCADWHLCRFSAADFPDWGRVYERLIDRAQEMGAWVGPPGRFYEALPHPDGTVDDALANLAANDTRPPRPQSRTDD